MAWRRPVRAPAGRQQRASERFRHLLADRRGPMDSRSRGAAARRCLFFHQAWARPGFHHPGLRKSFMPRATIWPAGPGRSWLRQACIAATFGLLAHILERRIPSTYAVLVALAAMVLSMPHFLARPHVLAMPVMVAWAHGLMTASERGQPPSFWLLPLIALWANLHGGFVFGLVLAGAFAIDALWNAEPCAAEAAGAALGRVRVGCVGGLLRHALRLGIDPRCHARFSILESSCGSSSEWAPADFSKLSPFELTILALIAGALYRGVKLSPPRIALVLGLLHMALSHGRNLEIFALLLPIVVLTPVSQQFALQPARSGRVTLCFGGAARRRARHLDLGCSRRTRCIRLRKPVAGRRGRSHKGAQSPAGSQRPCIRRLSDLAADARLHRRTGRVVRRKIHDGLLQRAGAQGRQPFSRSAQGLRHRRPCCCSRPRLRRACSIIWASGGGSTPTMWPSFMCAAEADR